VILGLGFSMSIVLCTLGIMEGFEQVFMTFLRQTEGDFQLKKKIAYSKIMTGDQEDQTQFQLEKSFLVEELKASVTSLVQKEAFLVYKNQHRGILLRGIDPSSFSKVFSMSLPVLQAGEIVLGQDFATTFGTKTGDLVQILLAGTGKGNHGEGEYGITKPISMMFRVKGFVPHGLYKKDSRMAYVRQEDLIGADDKSMNDWIVKMPWSNRLTLSDIRLLFSQLRDKWDFHLFRHYQMTPSWVEYGGLLEAVKVEKLSLGIILQVVVLVAAFNLLSFIFFLQEKKSQEFYLLEVLGSSPRHLKMVWSFFMFCIWISSCVFAVILSMIFSFLMTYFWTTLMPPSVYHLSYLKMTFDKEDFTLVFLSSLGWMVMMMIILFYKMSKTPLLSRLRKEFAP
jgi:ABC-type lipoprotein release transport system permease subunit